jgi:hypothetical protein
MDYFTTSYGFGDDAYYVNALGWNWDSKTRCIPQNIMENVYQVMNLKDSAPDGPLKEIKDIVERKSTSYSKWSHKIVNDLVQISKDYDKEVQQTDVEDLTLEETCCSM